MIKDNKLNIKILPYQLPFINSLNRINGFVAGVRSGKTYAAVFKILKLFEHRKRQNRKPKILFIEPTYEMIFDVALTTIEEIFDKYRIRSKLNKGRLIIKTGFGDIMLRSGQEPKRLKGKEVTDIICDEMDSYNFEHANILYNECLARMSGVDDATFNPVGSPEGFNFLYELFKDVETNKNKSLFRAKTKQNYYLPESYIQSLYELYDSKHIDMYLEGNFVNLTTGTVYYEFNEEINVGDFGGIKAVQNHIPILISYDFNINPYCVVICQQTKDKTKIIQFAEIHNENCNTEKATEDICNILRPFKSQPIHIHGDPAGNNRDTKAKIGITDYEIIKDVFKRNGFVQVKVKVRRSHPFVKDRISTVNSAFKNIQYLIDKSCSFTIDDFKRVIYKNNDIYKGNTAFTHLSDAAGYLIYDYFPITRAGVSNYLKGIQKNTNVISKNNFYSHINNMNNFNKIRMF